MLNLVEYNRAVPIRWTPEYVDVPAWEMDDPYLPQRTAPLGYLDYLTWQNRSIMLFPSLEGSETVVRQVTTAPGLVLSSEQRNPMHHYRIDKNANDNQPAFKVLRFTEGHALWRDSSALLNPVEKNVERPAPLNWAEKLKFEKILPDRRLTLTAYGMSTDPGKKKVFFYRGEQFEFPDELLTNQRLAITLDQALKQAENVRDQIWGAINHMAILLLSPEADLNGGRKPDPNDAKRLISHWNTEGLYWAALELPFYRFLDQLPRQPETALNRWESEIHRAALRAFDQTAILAGSSIRALKASAKAHQQLLAGLKRVLEPINQEEIHNA
jgi:CRISPR system Cascade subunit CasA